MMRHFIGIALLTVIILVVGGFGIRIAGSPTENRNVRYDQVRLRDIDTIASAISYYYEDNFKIPTTISQLLVKRVKTDAQYLKKQPKDPKTKTDYSYRVVSATSYELCANFDTSSEDIAKRKTGIEEDERLREMPDYYGYGEDKSHPKGRFCFTKTIPYTYQQKTVSPTTDPTRELRYEDLYPQATSSSY